jgi:hypothetical protein
MFFNMDPYKYNLFRYDKEYYLFVKSNKYTQKII